ncbi:response regulator [Candidatus Vecturithrix granuli]|uniref:Response regulator n=1 Tax=Vecturithrix granuli TaxID=1499967 RepID=A0A081C7S7_VECG1|nr:response regulator [Candidatus Vecturithrix granuli]
MARILIIDDDVQFLKMLRQMLEREGYEVVEALDGRVGIRLFRELRTELVITDIFMPEKEGIETTLELKREFPGVPIIIMSGGGRAYDFRYLDMAREFGADRAFIKPFERQELLAAIQELLDEREAPDRRQSF